MAILREALTGDNEVLMTTAATSLARLKTWNQMAVALLTEALGKRAPLRPMPILEGLKHVGASARQLAPVVAALITDKSLTLAERRLAAAALGSITRGTNAGVATLEQAMSSPSWPIVAGAAEGLALTEQVSSSAVTRLMALTNSADADWRRTAYRGLRGFGERATAAALVLVARIGEEQDAEMLEEVIHATVAMGVEAIAPLVELVRGGDIRKVPAAEFALTAIATQRPAEVLESLLADPHPHIRVRASKIVGELGQDAAAALPRLIIMLEQATDDERVDDILVVIAGCGPLDDAAADVVVRALLRWEKIPQEWAEQWLSFTGPAIGLAIERARVSATDKQRLRLEMLAGSMKRVEVNEFQEFAGIDLLLIETFCRVGELLRERGPTSWPTILETLQQQPLRESLVPLVLDIDPRTLSARVKALGEALGVALTDAAERRKGGLTEDGVRVLDRAKSYCQSLRARRLAERRS
jgi:HEAT repeat protein